MRTQPLLIALAAALAAGCGSPVCDKNESLNWGAKQGDCGGSTDKVLPAKDSCASGLKSCNSGDQKALEAMLDCLGKLPVCASAELSTWVSSRQACYDQAAGLSDACKAAFFGGGLPGQDGGVDGGEPDAGPQPMTDGGGALNLVVVADESNFALAWTSSQPGVVTQWSVGSENVVGLKYPDQFIPGAQWTLNDLDAGGLTKKYFFVAGLNAAGAVVMGDLGGSDAGGSADAGGCSGPLACPITQVCNLGACVEQPCTTPNTCPGGYLCPTGRCERIFGLDAGTVDAGSSGDGGVTRPLPFLSEKVAATTGVPGFSPEIFVSPFIGRNPAIVAIDSARQFVALEQESQLFGHLTIKRGADYPLSGARRPAQIDSIGTHIRLAYQPSGSTLYACYNVGLGVRVRKSRDYGQTWGAPSEAVDVAYEVPTDGGVPPLIQDCDIAPWRDGKALMVVVDDQNLVVRTVSDTLTLGPAELAFVSSGADGGANVFGPSRPAIATLPDDLIIHVGFTANRETVSGTDSEIYAVYRDPTTGSVFTNATRVNDNGSTGNPFPQDAVTLATDPVTKRAIAAFSSLESKSSATYNTIYVSLFNPTTRKWGTGSDLSVFFQNLPASAEYQVIPERPISELWDAFSPTFAVTPTGKMFLSFLAGPQVVGTAAGYHAYLVPFDIQVKSPKGAFGWFVPPAKKLGSTLVVDPSAGASAVQPTRTASAADSQLSVYTVYVEAMGTNGDEPNRAIMVTRP